MTDIDVVVEEIPKAMNNDSMALQISAQALTLSLISIEDMPSNKKANACHDSFLT